MLAGIQLLALGVSANISAARSFRPRTGELSDRRGAAAEGALTIILRCPRGHAQLCPRGRPWLHEFLQIHRTAQAILDAAELVQRTSIGGVGGVLVLVGGLR